MFNIFKAGGNMAKRGRPSLYDPNYHPQIAKWMCRAGAIDMDIAKEFGIHIDTFYEWKKIHPEFSESLKNNKKLIDSLVEDSMLKRALGYDYVEEETTIGRGENSKAVPLRIKKTKKHLAADVGAGALWLGNRQGWKGINARHEVTGKDGNPIEAQVTWIEQIKKAANQQQ